jgi:sec-independent protein translocase protein TatB
MFGFSWAEIGLIMAVALIAIGPKDLPVAIRTVTTLMKKARGMAAEFQGHIDEMMREANLSDVKTEINKLRKFDFKGAAEQVIDPDGSLREAVADPMATQTATPAYVPPVMVVEETPDSPAFIPPGTKRWGF